VCTSIFRLAAVAGVSALLTGCNAPFGIVPMPQRLDPGQQQRYEYGWDHFVQLAPTVERGAILDTLLFSQGWYTGVDRLYLVSEKQVGDVVVIMQSRFDRSRPDEDLFSVTFYDQKRDVVVRLEEFTPGEMQEAYDLYLTPEGESECESPEARAERMARLEEKNARLRRVEELFPQPPQAEPAPEPQ
jgi:hypothetical protein